MPAPSSTPRASAGSSSEPARRRASRSTRRRPLMSKIVRRTRGDREAGRSCSTTPTTRWNSTRIMRGVEVLTGTAVTGLVRIEARGVSIIRTPSATDAAEGQATLPVALEQQEHHHHGHDSHDRAHDHDGVERLDVAGLRGQRRPVREADRGRVQVGLAQRAGQRAGRSCPRRPRTRTAAPSPALARADTARR